MAIKTDDEDIRDVYFWMEHGGNGDFYLNLKENKNKTATRIDCRVAMSGGNFPHEVKIIIASLFRAMEKSGLNTNPQQNKPISSLHKG